MEMYTRRDIGAIGDGQKAQKVLKPNIFGTQIAQLKKASSVPRFTQGKIMLKLLEIACKVANNSVDRTRKAFIGCCAVRSDGAVVSSRNSATLNPTGISPRSHAERKCLSKSGYGSIMYIARIRKDNSIGCAKPCARCLASMRSMGVVKAYYTITENEYGVICP